MVSINKCEVVLIYTPFESAIVGSFIHLSNKLTAVSSITSETILSWWGKTHPLKPIFSFRAAETPTFLSGKRPDEFFRPTHRTRFLILSFPPARRGVIFADMVGLSLNFLVVFWFLSLPDFLSSLSVSCLLSAPALFYAVVFVAVVPSMAWGIPNISKFDLTCRWVSIICHSGMRASLPVASIAISICRNSCFAGRFLTWLSLCW